jgi:hypothetical protein
MTILREHESIEQAGELSFWMHTAFCITAAVILCFEINYGPSRDAEIQINTYVEAVQATRKRLAGRTHDVLAQRGIKLINAIFPEHDAYNLPSKRTNDAHPQQVDFKEVVARFVADWSVLGNEMDQQFFDGVPVERLSDQPDDQSIEDFDSWFNDIFATANTSY